MRLTKYKSLDFCRVGGDGNTDGSLFGFQIFHRQKGVRDHHGFELIFSIGKRQWALDFSDSRHVEHVQKSVLDDILAALLANPGEPLPEAEISQELVDALTTHHSDEDWWRTQNSELKAKKRSAQALYGSIPGVEGFGVGDGTIRVYLGTREAQKEFPASIEGVPFEFVFTGKITTT